MKTPLSYVRWTINGFREAIRAENLSKMAKINFLNTLKVSILFTILYALPSALVVHLVSLWDINEVGFTISFIALFGISISIILAISVFIGVFELWAFRRRGFDVGTNLRMSGEERNFGNLIAAVGLVAYIIFIQPIIIFIVLLIIIDLFI